MVKTMKVDRKSLAVGDITTCRCCGGDMVVLPCHKNGSGFLCRPCNKDHAKKIRWSKNSYNINGKFTHHGLHESPTWHSWKGMVQRCTNEKAKSYPRYGGAGITVCARWRLFKLFLEDMGERPKGKTLDRIDGDKGYCKENCRWATHKEQILNRRTTVLIEAFGRKQAISQWADEYKINRSTLRGRIKRGMSLEEAMTTNPAQGGEG